MIYFQPFLIVSIFSVSMGTTSRTQGPVPTITTYPTSVTAVSSTVSMGTTSRTQGPVPTITTYPTSVTAVSSTVSMGTTSRTPGPVPTITTYPTSVTAVSSTVSMGTTWRTQRAVPTITTYQTSVKAVSNTESTGPYRNFPTIDSTILDKQGGSTDSFTSKVTASENPSITTRQSVTNGEVPAIDPLPTLASFPNKMEATTDTLDSEELSTDTPNTTSNEFTSKDMTLKTSSTTTRQLVTDVSSLSPNSRKEETVGATGELTGRAPSLTSSLNLIALSASFVNLMSSRMF